MIDTSQKLSIDLEIIIPSDSILIKRTELQNLKDKSLTGVYWSMKDLELHIGKSNIGSKNTSYIFQGLKNT